MFMSVDGDDDDVRCWLLVVMNTTNEEMRILRMLSTEKTTHWFLFSFFAVACQAGVSQPRTTKTKKRWRKSLFSTLSCWNAHKNRWKTRAHTTKSRAKKMKEIANKRFNARVYILRFFTRCTKDTKCHFNDNGFVSSLLFFSFLFSLTPVREEREEKVTVRQSEFLHFSHSQRLHKRPRTTHRTIYQRNFQDNS